jgi:hypothetical protein
MLEGETTFETFLTKRRRWLAGRATAPTHRYPSFLIFRAAAAGLRWRLLIMEHINSAASNRQHPQVDLGDNRCLGG